MSQHDFNLANASGPNFRADANAALAALATLSAGAVAPTPTFANQFWFDTSVGYLKKRDNANTTWQVLLAIDATGNVTFKPAVNDRTVALLNATNAVVASLQTTTGGDGRVLAEDRNSALRIMLTGLTTGGKIFLDGDESSGKQVAPTFVLGPLALTGLTGQTVSGLAGATEVSIAFANLSFGDTASMVVQLGTGAGLVSSGYAAGSAALTDAGTVLHTQFTTGFGFRMGTAGQLGMGIMRLMFTSSANIWVASHGGRFSSFSVVGGGSTGLPSLITQVRVTSGSGSTYTGGHFTVHVRY